MHNVAEVVIEKIVKRPQGIYGNKDWNQASRVGATCARELVLWRTAPETAIPPDPKLQLIFKHGAWMEKESVAQLEDAGYEISERDASFEWKAMQLRGRIDGKIRLDGEKRPLEIKGYAPHSWEKLNTIEDFLSSSKEYLRKVPSQLLSYLLLDGKTDTAVLYLLNKLTGEPKTILLRLEGPTLEWGEALLKKLQLVNACIEKGTLPDRVEFDESVCGVCPFRASCLTDIPVSARGMAVLTGEQENELLGLLAEREKLAESVKRFEDVDEEVKRIVKGIPTIVCGDYIIKGKNVDVEEQVKKAYSYWKKSIINITKKQKADE